MALAQRAFAARAVQARPAVALARPARTQTVKVQALFGFGGGSKAASGATPASYICIDCGYIYDGGDFKGAPSSYKCPACGSPKSRFKVYKGEVKGRPNNTGAAMKKRMAEKAW